MTFPRLAQAPLAHRLIAVVLLWSALFVAVDVVVLGVHFDYYASVHQTLEIPVVLALNLLLFALVCVALSVVLGRAWAAALLAGAIYVVFGIASALKLANLGEPILPWDYLSARQFAGMAGGYAQLDATKAAVLVIGGALAVLSALALKRESPVRRSRALLVLLIAIVPACALYFATNPARKPLGLFNIFWAQGANLRSNGLLNHFAMNLKPAVIVAPSGYNESRIAEMCLAGDAIRVANNRKNVVVILNEAFTRIDRTLSPEVTFDGALAPFFSSLGPTRFTVPTFGGLTANAEFEILTGTPMASFSYGAIPYQQYVNRDIATSLPLLFKRAGYRTVALHPFARSFWNRDVAYRHLGFDEFLTLDDLQRTSAPGYVPDSALLQPIETILADRSSPVFVFVVTMENHGPWFEKRYARNDVALRTTPSDWTPSAVETVRNYAQGVRHADAFLSALVNYLRARDDTVVAMFGDHHPTMVVPDMKGRNIMSLRFGDPTSKMPPEYGDRTIMETEIAFWPSHAALRDEAQALYLGPAPRGWRACRWMDSGRTSNVCSRSSRSSRVDLP